MDHPVKNDDYRKKDLHRVIFAASVSDVNVHRFLAIQSVFLRLGLDHEGSDV